MDSVVVVPAIFRSVCSSLDVCCFDADWRCSDHCACSLAKAIFAWFQDSRCMASRCVYGLVSLFQLKDIAMLAFDTWIQQKHPELLMEFKKLPRVRKTQTFYDWARQNYPGVILKEWPVVAKIRVRHLLSENESE